MRSLKAYGIGMALFVVTFGVTGPAQATVNRYWDINSSFGPQSWFSASHWHSNHTPPRSGIPQAVDDINFQNPGGGIAEITSGAAVGRIMRVGSLSDGVGGDGAIEQSGGSLTLSSSLYLGRSRKIGLVGGPYLGTYDLSGGTLTVGYQEYVGDRGNGTFTHTAGLHELTGTSLRSGLFIANGEPSVSSYALSGTGQLETQNLWVGYFGTGSFTHSAGTATVRDTFLLGAATTFDNPGVGTYTLSGTGQLSVTQSLIAGHGKGTFHQSAGTFTNSGLLGVGNLFAGIGVYNLSGGTLSTGSMEIGQTASSGTWNITNAAASITISDWLRFNATGALSAVAGTTFHMTGSNFENRSTNEANLAGLANVTMIFEGGAVTDTFEVGGTYDGGFTDNFALGTLQLGGVQAGKVKLVDLSDNGNRGSRAEALFLHNLAIASGSQLVLNGLCLYVEGDVEATLDGWIADGRIVDGTDTLLMDALYIPESDWTVIPEPATMTLLAVGGLALLRRKKR